MAFDLNKVDFTEAEKRVLLSLAEAASRSTASHKRLDRDQDRFNKFVAGKGFTNSNTGGGSYCLGVVKHLDVPQRVFKICSTDAKSDAYFAYIEWVYLNEMWKTNPHFPRVYNIELVNDGEMAVVTLEELQCWDYEPDFFADTGENTFLEDDWRLAVQALGQRMPTPTPGYKNRPMTTAAAAIKNEFEGKVQRFDLHRMNVMLRGEVMVIIDPIL